MSPSLLTAFLDLTNRTPLEISLRAFMGYPGLFQHTYICLFIIFHLNNKFCLHSSLTLLDPFIGSGVLDMNEMFVIVVFPDHTHLLFFSHFHHYSFVPSQKVIS